MPTRAVACLAVPGVRRPDIEAPAGPAPSGGSASVRSSPAASRLPEAVCSPWLLAPSSSFRAVSLCLRPRLLPAVFLLRLQPRSLPPTSTFVVTLGPIQDDPKLMPICSVLVPCRVTHRSRRVGHILWGGRSTSTTVLSARSATSECLGRGWGGPNSGGLRQGWGRGAGASDPAHPAPRSE